MHTRRTRAALAALFALALGGCETTGGPAPQAAAVPLTRQQASLECWMATEKDAAKMGLDKRADVVTKCIAEKMGGAQTAAAAPASKPDAKPKPDARPKT